MSVVFCVASLVGVTQLALADSECTPADDKAGAAQLKKAEDNERAGKLKEAYQAANKLGDCLPEGGYQRQKAMLKRVGLQLGQQEEKQGRLAAAFDWYKGSGNDAEAGRVKMKQVNASPRDRQVGSDAMDYFKGGNDKSLAELRQLAAKNGDLELANEEKAFAARKESFDELEKAKGWFYLVSESAAKKVRDRAEQRGDTLVKEDIYRLLENARHYYSFAEAKPKEKALKDKALRLAQEHEKKGEITQATEFYSLADESAKGNELQARSEAQHMKSEEKRQKQFKKGQDDLEKELGL
jgi:predicted Zn-dependent protease